MERIAGVYQIKNKTTGERYIGSSTNVHERFMQHKRPNRWEREDSKLYQDFKKYGIENFEFLYLAFVEPQYLKQVEQEFIEMLTPEYNTINASFDKNEWSKDWRKTETGRKNDARYKNKVCVYKGEEIKLNTLATRFYRQGVEQPYVEARKYLK